MKFSKNPQGTEEWLAEREKRVTASDASIINGTNTFGGNSPYKLWQLKHGILKRKETNLAMMEGTMLEEEALHRFNKDYRTNFTKPNGGFHDEHNWMMASLDGYNEEDKTWILEIKCGVKTYEKAMEGTVPPYYYDQIQHQLFVSERKICYYMAYRPDKEPIVIEIARDYTYFDIMFEKEKEFYKQLIDFKEPALTEEDYREVLEEEALECATVWKYQEEDIKERTKNHKMLTEKLKNYTDGGNCIFPNTGVKVNLRFRKGNIDFNKVVKELEIDKELLEKHRKPESSWLQPIIIKQA